MVNDQHNQKLPIARQTEPLYTFQLSLQSIDSDIKSGTVTSDEQRGRKLKHLMIKTILLCRVSLKWKVS